MAIGGHNGQVVSRVESKSVLRAIAINRQDSLPSLDWTSPDQYCLASRLDGASRTLRDERCCLLISLLGVWEFHNRCAYATVD